jgi:SHS2 domain-containing protein
MKKIDYFDHEADIGIMGRGNNLEEAFVNAALAVFNIMTDTSLVPPEHKVLITFEENDQEFAFVTWLNLLLAKAREGGMVFSKFELTHTCSEWLGYAYGAKWRDEFSRGTEVKGATLTMLSVKKNFLWEACCVVDV